MICHVVTQNYIYILDLLPTQNDVLAGVDKVGPYQ